MAVDVNVPLSPGWWLVTLQARLQARWQKVEEFGTYYDGENRLAFASVRYRTEFEAMLARWNDNFCELVVDATEERLNVEGFRFSDGSDPGVAWDLWQGNDLDAGSQLGHIEALVHGGAYTLVWAGGDGKPTITIEHPSQCIVALDPADRRRRLAGLKHWKDDTGAEMATVYLPEGIYKFEQSGGAWRERAVPGEAWPVPNPLGKVPLVPLANRARLLDPGRSDLVGIVPIQDAITKLAADMLISSEFSAYLQRWATGVDLPLVFDSNGDPVLDSDGRQLRAAPNLESGPGSTWFFGGADNGGDAKVGAFPATQLSNYVNGIDMLVSHLSAKSRVPAHFFLVGNAQLPSGQSIRSAEAGLVAKISRKQRPLGEGWEETIRLGLAILGDPRSADESMETIWGGAETPTVGEEVDAATKKHAMGIPLAEILEDLGYSPQRIDRIVKAVDADTDPWRPDFAARAHAAAELATAGFDPAQSLVAVGLDPVRHLGLLTSRTPPGPVPIAGAA